MSTGYLYEPLPDIGAGRRLHLNENTGGCSPAVLRAIARLTREDIAVYPAYDSRDEGLRRAPGCDNGPGAAHERPRRGHHDGGPRPVAANRRGGGVDRGAGVRDVRPLGDASPARRVVRMVPPPDLRFDLDAVRAAITPATRLVLLASPNNPTGVIVAGRRHPAAG